MVVGNILLHVPVSTGNNKSKVMRVFLLILMLLPTIVLANSIDLIDIDRHPSKSELSVKVAQNQKALVKIFMDTNKLVWSANRSDAEFKLDFTYFPPGHYQVQILVNGEMEQFTFRKD